MGTRVSLVGAVAVAAAVSVVLGWAGFAAGFATGRLGAPEPTRDVPVVAPAVLEPDLLTELGLEPVEPDLVTLPEVTLQVHTDGCGVIRPEIADEPHGLGWSVVDDAGFEVLQRNALGQTHFRYFGSGTYTMKLVAWDGETYSPISNTVTISC